MAREKELNNVDVVGELQKEVTTTQLHPKSIQTLINSILPENGRKEGCSGDDDDIQELESGNRNEPEERVSDNSDGSGDDDDMEELESGDKDEREERVSDNPCTLVLTDFQWREKMKFKFHFSFSFFVRVFLAKTWNPTFIFVQFSLLGGKRKSNSLYAFCFSFFYSTKETDLNFVFVWNWKSRVSYCNCRSLFVVTNHDATDSRIINAHFPVRGQPFHQSKMTEEDCVIFFTGEGERRAERRLKKSQVTAERLAQMFGVSHSEEALNKPLFSGNAYYNYGRNSTAVDTGTLT